jgi:hydroxyethylthiazole kinase-like uncharacterized protein yjeF
MSPPARASRTTVVVTPAVLRDHSPPEPASYSHKGDRGCVLVIGGTRETPGAVVLAGIAALRAGAGVLQVATAESVARAVAVALPEARVIGIAESPLGDLSGGSGSRLAELAGAAQAVLIGPGLADADALATLMPSLLAGLDSQAVVIDAHALRAITPELLHRHRDRVVLTPNVKEAAELLGADAGDVERESAQSIRSLVDRFGCTVALRGQETYIQAPRTSAYHDESGTPGLGTSGSGDVLVGYLAGLLARGAAPLAAALWAVHVHGQAGQRLSARLGHLGFLARELLDDLSIIAAELV